MPPFWQFGEFMLGIRMEGIQQTPDASHSRESKLTCSGTVV
jgi:hypothetical protein